MVQANALMLAETTNLLLMPGRAKDRLGWVIRTQAMKDAALEAAKAAEQKSTDAIFDAGTHIYQSCTGCHQQYLPNLNAPPSGPRGSHGSANQ
jgi:cytochrome c553